MSKLDVILLTVSCACVRRLHQPASVTRTLHNPRHVPNCHLLTATLNIQWRSRRRCRRSRRLNCLELEVVLCVSVVIFCVYLFFYFLAIMKYLLRFWFVAMFNCFWLLLQSFLCCWLFYIVLLRVPHNRSLNLTEINPNCKELINSYCSEFFSGFFRVYYICTDRLSTRERKSIATQFACPAAANPY